VFEKYKTVLELNITPGLIIKIAWTQGKKVND
jgi:hypothetical protein